ncbi:MAG: hypothetical protein AB7Q17_03310 [Phycisphaerae bacterium]
MQPISCWALRARVRFFGVAAMSILAHDIASAGPGSWSGSLNARVGPDLPIQVPLHVEKRELLTVSVTGTIRVGDAPWSGPAGTDYYGFDPEHRPPFGFTHGIVMLKIGENHYPIEGGARTLHAPRAGSLQLYVNDDVSSDNEGAFQVFVEIRQGIVGDADEDGISDAREDELLEYFAPELKFTRPNDEGGTHGEGDEERPADAYWFLRNADLQSDGDEVIARNQAPFYPEWLLSQTNMPGSSMNYLDVNAVTAAETDIRNSHRHGQERDRILAARNVGVYGHVTESTSDEIEIEYWLFYPNSDTYAPLDIADHEGDWELFELVIDRTEAAPSPSQIRTATWWGHSTRLARWYRDGPIEWEFNTGLLNCAPPDYPCLPPMPLSHSPVLVEYKTHGSWPAPARYNDFTGYAIGDGYCYVAQDITNVGEATRPRLGCEVILQYNGRWGAGNGIEGVNPEGPALKGQWARPLQSVSEALYVGQWSHGRNHPNGVAPLGRISWPYAVVGDAVTASNSGQTVLIFPGNYNEQATYSNPVTLIAPHGSVTIGQ